MVFFIARGKPGKEKNMRTEYKTNNINPFEVQSMRRTKSVAEIAAFYGISIRGLEYWAKRHNFILQRVTDWEIAEGIWNKTPKQLAAEYNVSLNVIYYRLTKMGICAKQDGQR